VNLKIFSPKFFAKIAVFSQNKAKLCKIWTMALVFEKNDNFFCWKLSKITEHCDHNIDPRLGISTPCDIWLKNKMFIMFCKILMMYTRNIVGRRKNIKNFLDEIGKQSGHTATNETTSLPSIYKIKQRKARFVPKPIYL
jgi:hypothetical protein